MAAPWGLAEDGGGVVGDGVDVVVAGLEYGQPVSDAAGHGGDVAGVGQVDEGDAAHDALQLGETFPQVV